jgi:hypothetical protein
VLRLHGEQAVRDLIARTERLKLVGVYRLSELPPKPMPSALDIGFVVRRACLIEDKETTIRVVKSRYGSEIGIPGEITVVWDEERTQFQVMR